MRGIEYYLIDQKGGEQRLHIDTGEVPAMGDFVVINEEEYVVFKRVWTPEVSTDTETRSPLGDLNGCGLRIYLKGDWLNA